MVLYFPAEYTKVIYFIKWQVRQNSDYERYKADVLSDRKSTYASQFIIYVYLAR